MDHQQHQQNIPNQPAQPSPTGNNFTVNPTPESTTSIDQATHEFQNGVTAILQAWSALRTAVENEWGGPTSLTKAETLRQTLFSHFDYNKKSKWPSVSKSELEDDLDAFMEDEFSMVLEDESEMEIVDLLFRLWEGCGNGDFQLSRELVQQAQQQQCSKRALEGA